MAEPTKKEAEQGISLADLREARRRINRAHRPPGAQGRFNRRERILNALGTTEDQVSDDLCVEDLAELEEEEPKEELKKKAASVGRNSRLSALVGAVIGKAAL